MDMKCWIVLQHRVYVRGGSTYQFFDSLILDIRIEPVVTLDHFDVFFRSSGGDTAIHKTAVEVGVNPRDPNNNYLTIAGSILLDFSLDENAARFGNLVLPNGSQQKSLSGIDYYNVQGGSVKYLATGEKPNAIEEIRISVNISPTHGCYGSASGEGTFALRLPSITMSFDPPVIAPGDTAAIILKQQSPDGTLSDFPPEKLIEVGILAGSRFGKILSPFPTPLMAELFVDTAPFFFVSMGNIDQDSAVVRIRAGVPMGAEHNYYSSISSTQEIPRAPVRQALSQSKINDPLNKIAAPSEALQVNDVEEEDFDFSDYTVTELVIKQQGLDHFAVSIAPDTIAHNDTAAVTVQAKDGNNNDISISDGTSLNFSLDASGESLGNLIAPNGSQAKSLSGTSYSDARAGKVKYIANGARPDSTREL